MAYFEVFLFCIFHSKDIFITKTHICFIKFISCTTTCVLIFVRAILLCKIKMQSTNTWWRAVENRNFPLKEIWTIFIFYLNIKFKLELHSLLSNISKVKKTGFNLVKTYLYAQLFSAVSEKYDLIDLKWHIGDYNSLHKLILLIDQTFMKLKKIQPLPQLDQKVQKVLKVILSNSRHYMYITQNV